jgi:hypothetical protein
MDELMQLDALARPVTAPWASSLVLRTEHEVMTEDMRREMLAKLKAGERLELYLDAVTFSQQPGVRNRNFVRFGEENLASIAKSGVNSVFLRDHRQGSMADAGGRIVESVARQSGSAIEFAQTLLLVRDWAVEDALLGMMRAFSIGWNPIAAPGKLTPEVLCSVCMAPIQHCVWELGHWRGREVKGQVVELIFQNAELLETSAVPVPAVREVRAIGIRQAALSHELVTAELSMFGVPIPQKETMMDLSTILSALGLASGGVQEILAAVQQRDATANAKLATLQLQLDEAHAELAAATARARAAEAKAGKNAEELAEEKARQWADGLVAEGKLAPSGELYEHWVEQYKLNPEKAQRLASALPRVTPVGKDSQSERKNKQATLKSDGTPDFAALALQLNAADREAASKYGLKVEDYVRFNIDDLAGQYGWEVKGA